MKPPYTLYGWHLSYFTGKVRCYLLHKGIAFTDQPVNMYTLLTTIKRQTGAVVMPVLRTPKGAWVQDSSVIIDQLEAAHPQRPVIPTSPVPRFAAYLLEAWCDEWWIPIAMHTRWTYPENYALFEREAGRHLLPGFPGPLQRRAVAYIAANLRAKLHTVGVRPEQFATMDRWTTDMLDLLDAHFAQQPYLLGAQPTLADFSLAGPMVAHLGRDPWPARELVAPRRHLRAWIERIAAPKPEPAPEPARAVTAPMPASDALPDTLTPVFQAIFAEFVPLLEGINQQVGAALPALPPGKALRRSLADVEVPMGAGRFRRSALPYTLWMAQRALDVYRAMPPAEQAQVQAWLSSLGGERLLALDIPRLRLQGLRVLPEPAAS